MKKLWFIVPFIFILLLTVSCEAAGNDHHNVERGNEDQSYEDGHDTPPASSEPEEIKPYKTNATLIAVGDIMVHSSQYMAAYSVTESTYSFDDNFTEVAPILKEGDWVIGNLETTFAGPEVGFSGYPQFNTPDELADALKNAGFNILGTANNHSFDRRERGVLRTLEQLKARDLVAVGTNASMEQSREIQIVTKNNIDMALLAYTYGTNGIPLPQDKPYLVNLIDEERMKEDIERARKLEADVVTVMLHYGDEYARHPSEYQKELARKLISWGADIILGSHTHQVQPYEMIETQDSNGNLRQGVVIYSLGNFISNQGPEHDLPVYTDVGVIFKVELIKHHPEERLEFGKIETIPTWVHKYRTDGKRHYRVLPLEEVITSRDDRWLTEQEYSMLEAYFAEMSSHVDSLAVPVSD